MRSDAFEEVFAAGLLEFPQQQEVRGLQDVLYVVLIQLDLRRVQVIQNHLKGLHSNL